MNQLINHKPVRRTAPATPGLLNTSENISLSVIRSVLLQTSKVIEMKKKKIIFLFIFK